MAAATAEWRRVARVLLRFDRRRWDRQTDGTDLVILATFGGMGALALGGWYQSPASVPISPSDAVRAVALLFPVVTLASFTGINVKTPLHGLMGTLPYPKKSLWAFAVGRTVWRAAILVILVGMIPLVTVPLFVRTAPATAVPAMMMAGPAWAVAVILGNWLSLKTAEARRTRWAVYTFLLASVVGPPVALLAGWPWASGFALGGLGSLISLLMIAPMELGPLALAGSVAAAAVAVRAFYRAPVPELEHEGASERLRAALAAAESSSAADGPDVFGANLDPAWKELMVRIQRLPYREDVGPIGFARGVDAIADQCHGSDWKSRQTGGLALAVFFAAVIALLVTLSRQWTFRIEDAPPAALCLYILGGAVVAWDRAPSHRMWRLKRRVRKAEQRVAKKGNPRKPPGLEVMTDWNVAVTLPIKRQVLEHHILRPKLEGYGIAAAALIAFLAIAQPPLMLVAQGLAFGALMATVPAAGGLSVLAGIPNPVGRSLAKRAARGAAFTSWAMGSLAAGGAVLVSALPLRFSGDWVTAVLLIIAALPLLAGQVAAHVLGMREALVICLLPRESSTRLIAIGGAGVVFGAWGVLWVTSALTL